MHACLDLTGFLMFFRRQPQLTCARILNYVKHVYAAWIAWALTWRGSHTTRALIQLSFSFSLNKTPVTTLGWHRVSCWRVELSIRRVDQIVKHWYRYSSFSLVPAIWEASDYGSKNYFFSVLIFYTCQHTPRAFPICEK